MSSLRFSKDASTGRTAISRRVSSLSSFLTLGGHGFNLSKCTTWYFLLCNPLILQMIKTFSIREGWWYIGIKGSGGVKSKGTRIVIEKEK